ncbi:MAG: hypothetical protein JKY93_00965 [Gammaproteobacteria bacterium]|nr:hypothetical protein [Gammaproteobacteria bacterium]
MPDAVKSDHIDTLSRLCASAVLDKELRANILNIMNWMIDTEFLHFRYTNDHLPTRGQAVYAQSLDGNYHILKLGILGAWRCAATGNQFMPPITRWAYQPKSLLQQNIRKAQHA